jgi:hypothetical protein
LLEFPIVRDRREAAGEHRGRSASTSGRSSRAVALCALLALACLFPAPAKAKPSETPFAIQPGSFHVSPASSRAGAHADLTIGFEFAHSEDEKPFNDVKDTVIDLPAGFAGAASAVPVCTDAQLLVTEEEFKPKCPLDSQLGTITVAFTISSGEPARMTLPLFNMEPGSPNAPARLGFKALLFGGLTVSIPDVPLFAEPSSVSIRIWGTPASPGHDAERGQECLPAGLLEGEESCVGGGNPATVEMRPFLDNPTRCGAARARVRADSWEEPESWSEAEAEAGPISECGQVPFAPSVTVKPTSDAAESPTGLDLSILEPQSSTDPEASVSSSLDEVSIALPEGLAVDLAAASGLGACTSSELEREVAGAEGGCPPDSRIGSAEIETPLLEEAATGSIYLAKPPDSQSGSPFAFYLVAKAKEGGAVVRLAGRLLPDAQSGLLRVALDEIPQLPLSRVAMHLPAGAGSLLVTPAACGTYAAQAELTPSSDPTTPWHGSSSFEIDRGTDGASCPAGGLPFSPGFAAASSRTRAGAFSSLDLRLTRKPGEAPLASVSLELPPGMVADIGAVAPCPEAALTTIADRSGADERADPSCPGESEIGRVSLELGAGSRLARIGGSAYLAGPYRGATRSVVLVIPGLLGPFDLGTVAVRERLRVDPRTGAVTIGSTGSDEIPQLLDGVPLRPRELDLDLDRRRFLRNPTSCRPLSLLVGVTAAGANAAAGQPSSTLSAPFRATGCRRLGFAPRPRLRFLGALHRNGHPGLRLALGSGRGESGLARAAIDLPRTELLDSGHIRDVCTPAQLAATRCPAASAYGFAIASTPFLSEPLRGHVYLLATRRGLPSLAAALSSREMSLDFVARLEATGGGLRIAPRSVPDLPIAKLVLEMRGGSRGLLVNSADLCAGRLHARARFSAQNGRRRELRLPVHVSCRPRGKDASKKTRGTR